MFQEFWLWASNINNLIGAGITGTISFIFIILLIRRKEASFFESSLHRAIFWALTTGIMFLTSFWEISVYQNSSINSAYYNVLDYPLWQSDFEGENIFRMQLSIPSIMAFNYVLFVLLYRIKGKRIAVNLKEMFVLVYTSLLAIDLLQMKIFPPAVNFKGIGGIGGGGYMDGLLLIPLTSLIVLGIINYIDGNKININLFTGKRT